jgi:hypothetical protein
MADHSGGDLPARLAARAGEVGRVRQAGESRGRRRQRQAECRRRTSVDGHLDFVRLQVGHFAQRLQDGLLNRVVRLE